MVITGPWPQARVTAARSSGATTFRCVRAGTESRESSTGRVVSWPNWLTVLASCTSGNETLIRSVVNGRLNVTRLPNPMVASRVPSGLLILTVVGIDPPAVGCTISDVIRRLPCQPKWMTGLAESAIHGVLPDPLTRLAGNPAGRAPGVVATPTCSTPGPGGLTRSSSLPSGASRPAPGTASALACNRMVTGLATVKVLAMGGVAAGTAPVSGDGTCWWKEKAVGVPWPAASVPGAGGSCAGSSRRVTRTPGISTSDIPAPGLPGVTRPAPAIVIRSQRVMPGTTFSCWVAPVAATAVVALPAAVDTRSLVAISRSGPSSSRRIPIRVGRFTWLGKVTWIHCPTGVSALPSAHAVAGSRSKALAGSSCWVSAIQEP